MYTLIDTFCAKYVTFDLIPYRGVIVHDTEVSCKISRKTDLWFGKFFTRTHGSVKVGTLRASLCPK